MRLEHYPIEISEQEFTFGLDSEGPKGRIRKIVQFAPMAGENLFNLALGDKNVETGYFDDMSVSDNGDTEKVLATVAFVVYIFAVQFPDARIYATGSTLARTRLYRMGINKYNGLIATDFYIFGKRTDEEWKPFRRDKGYQAFIVTRKEFIFEI